MATFKVALRGGFSDRNGIRKENTAMQTTELDARTRVAIVNAMNVVFQSGFPMPLSFSDDFASGFARNVYQYVYAQIVEPNRIYRKDEVLRVITDTILHDEYDAVLTVVEYVIQYLEASMPEGFFRGRESVTHSAFMNGVFEQEYVGYRFVKGYITRITDDLEIAEVEKALYHPYVEVHGHIAKANTYLSNRDAPDYENSIKESISAVERMCSIIVGKSTSLGDALGKLKKSGIVVIHPQLEEAFMKLYAYTNGASGVRHAGKLGGPDSTFEEAKYMLVACCTFVNYLIAVWAKVSQNSE